VQAAINQRAGGTCPPGKRLGNLLLPVWVGFMNEYEVGQRKKRYTHNYNGF